MFKRTYGSMYEQHADLFKELFSDLENYYQYGNINLVDALDTFFNKLYQKMFRVINQQYKMSDEYLTCVSEYMKELKPFGDVPAKLSLQLKRSFVATRTFYQALNTAADVAKHMGQIRMPPECIAPLTHMQQCGVCNGYAEKPCNNFCFNVMKGCFNHFDELDTEWDNFVAAMDKVAERLLGPFNIVMVVEPINIKISEAIMNFQVIIKKLINHLNSLKLINLFCYRKQELKFHKKFLWDVENYRWVVAGDQHHPLWSHY